MRQGKKKVPTVPTKGISPPYDPELIFPHAARTEPDDNCPRAKQPGDNISCDLEQVCRITVKGKVVVLWVLTIMDQFCGFLESAVSLSKDAEDIKARFKLRHVMKPAKAQDMWVVGGTIRRLDRAPKKVSEVLAMFPNLAELKPQAARTLTPVADKRLFEKNRDVALIGFGNVEAQIELATIFAANGDAPGEALARELSIELPKCCSASASAFAEHMRKALEGELLSIERREDLLYR